MTVTYTNRRGKIYCLHQGTTKAGNPQYSFGLRRKRWPSDARSNVRVLYGVRQVETGRFFEYLHAWVMRT